MEVVNCFLLKKEKEAELHRQLDKHILNSYLNQPKKEFSWTMPFQALYYYWTATPQQKRLFKRAWTIILQKDDNMPG
jgi:hypothetical protein